MVQGGKYECPLSAETAQMAADELREDEATRENALQHMRKWIEDNARIETCRTGQYGTSKGVGSEGS